MTLQTNASIREPMREGSAEAGDRLRKVTSRHSYSSRGMTRTTLTILILCGLTASLLADTGDPQIRTDHPWYPGELAISTFERLFVTQAEAYQRVTGIEVNSDEQKALASWLWRNTHFWHGETGRRDLWGEGFKSSRDTRLREYWNGLFGYGFGLCGTTHSQWTAEFDTRSSTVWTPASAGSRS